MNVFDEIEADLKLIFTNVGTFLKPFISQFMTSAGALVLTTAETELSAVLADPTILTDTAKRDAAAASLVKTLASKGIALTESAALAAVVAAEAKIKTSTPTTPAAPAQVSNVSSGPSASTGVAE
jgi:hypothetical protein